MADVLLIGLGGTTLTALESLIAHVNVAAVVRRPDGADDPVLSVAARRGIPVFSDTSIRAIGALVESLEPHCVVVSSYDRILPAWLVGQCPFINVHYSPLPRYRGRANVNWAILNGEPCTAISIHVLERQLDAGGLLFQEMVPIGADDTIGGLYERLNALQQRELGPAVLRHLAGDAGQPQVGEASYGCTRLPGDGEIDWRQSTASIYALVRAVGRPFPGAFTWVDGTRLTIWKAVPVENPPRYDGRVPGRIAAISRAKGHVDVLTGDGVLRVIEVQVEGQAPCAAASVVTSVKMTLGLNTTDLLNRIRALEAQMARVLGAPLTAQAR